MPPSKLFSVFAMLIAFIGLIYGSANFVVCTFIEYWQPSGLLAFFTAILAIITIHLNRLHLKNHLTEWYSTDIIRGIQTFSFIGIEVGCSFIIWNVFQILYHSLSLMDIDKRRLIFAVNSILLAFYGCLLYCIIKGYSKLIDEHQRLLPITHRI